MRQMAGDLGYPFWGGGEKGCTKRTSRCWVDGWGGGWPGLEGELWGGGVEGRVTFFLTMHFDKKRTLKGYQHVVFYMHLDTHTHTATHAHTHTHAHRCP